jgi:plasmid stabilization system protein ParE
MKVILTENAEENLWQIYRYHSDYDEAYADTFQSGLDDFIFSSLSQHPKLGTVYNPSIGLYRMVYLKRYNIYYVVKPDALYIVYILDGRMEINMTLGEPDAPLPDLR